MMRIEQWYVTQDPYTAPELRGSGIKGAIYGHPTYPDGSSIELGVVASVNGRVLSFHDGTEVELGEIAQGYRGWCGLTGKTIDESEPFKLIGGAR